MLKSFGSFRLIPIRRNINITASCKHEVNLNTYHQISDETLEDLNEKLEEVLEDRYDKGADVALSNGVLTVVVDDQNTYVINKQTPNKQIWLSSPISGPKRFDLVEGQWIERNSKIDLKKLLSKELSTLLKNHVDV